MTTTDKPLRIQRTRQKGKGYLFPEGEQNDLPIVAVSRPLRWGNPYKVGENGVKDVLEAIALFEKDINDIVLWEQTIKAELKGKNLACWCKLGEPCHADVLLKIANS
jgi:hypothetical protein